MMHRCGKCTINEVIYVYTLYTPLITLSVFERKHGPFRGSGGALGSMGTLFQRSIANSLACLTSPETFQDNILSKILI